MIISQTPLRVSFAGGGTDLPAFYRVDPDCPGYTVGAGIDKYVWCIVQPRFDSEIWLSWSRKERVHHVDDLQHELIREAMRRTKVSQGVEIVTLADIPSEGSGLGSSSAVTVGVLNALYTYQGMHVPTEQLARDACQIEIDILGKPIGKQDQYMAAYGGLRGYTFHADERVTVETFAFSPWGWQELERTLMLTFTGKTRQAETILHEQARDSDRHRLVLESMRDNAHALAQWLRRPPHRDPVVTLGFFLRHGWENKKKLAAGISNPELEQVIARAEACGILRYKVCGAGGGGFLLTCAATPEQTAFASSSSQPSFPVRIARHGSRIIFNVT